MTLGIRGGAGRLSTASIYEQLFQTRHRRAGRPLGDTEPLFAGVDADPVIQMVAKRRAYAVVHEENRDRLKQVFDTELKVLKRRGVEVVAQDAGVKLARNEDGTNRVTSVAFEGGA